MEIVSAPGRQFRTYSMWIGIGIGTLDAAILLMNQFGDIHFLTPQTVLVVNAMLGFLIIPAKLLLQNIPVSTEDKIAMVAQAAAQPMKPDEENIVVHVEGQVIPVVPPNTNLKEKEKSWTSVKDFINRKEDEKKDGGDGR